MPAAPRDCPAYRRLTYKKIQAQGILHQSYTLGDAIQNDTFTLYSCKRQGLLPDEICEAEDTERITVSGAYRSGVRLITTQIHACIGMVQMLSAGGHADSSAAGDFSSRLGFLSALFSRFLEEVRKSTDDEFQSATFDWYLHLSYEHSEDVHSRKCKCKDFVQVQECIHGEVTKCCQWSTVRDINWGLFSSVLGRTMWWPTSEVDNNSVRLEEAQFLQREYDSLVTSQEFLSTSASRKNGRKAGKSKGNGNTKKKNPKDESKPTRTEDEDRDVVPGAAVLDGGKTKDAEEKPPNLPTKASEGFETVENIVAGHSEETNPATGDMDTDIDIPPSTDPTQDGEQVPNNEPKPTRTEDDDRDDVAQVALLEGEKQKDGKEKEPDPLAKTNEGDETVDNIVAGHPKGTNPAMGDMDTDVDIHLSTDQTQDGEQDPNDEPNPTRTEDDDRDDVAQVALLEGEKQKDRKEKEPDPLAKTNEGDETVDSIVAGHPEETNPAMGDMDTDVDIHPSTDPTEDGEQAGERSPAFTVQGEQAESDGIVELVPRLINPFPSAYGDKHRLQRVFPIITLGETDEEQFSTTFQFRYPSSGEYEMVIPKHYADSFASLVWDIQYATGWLESMPENLGPETLKSARDETSTSAFAARDLVGSFLQEVLAVFPLEDRQGKWKFPSKWISSFGKDIYQWRPTSLIADYDGCHSDHQQGDDPRKQGYAQGKRVIEVQKMLDCLQLSKDIQETPSTPSNSRSSQLVRAGKRPASSSLVRSTPKKAKKERSGGGCQSDNSQSGGDDWSTVQSHQRLQALQQYPVQSLIGPSDPINNDNMQGSDTSLDFSTNLLNRTPSEGDKQPEDSDRMPNSAFTRSTGNVKRRPGRPLGVRNKVKSVVLAGDPSPPRLRPRFSEQQKAAEGSGTEEKIGSQEKTLTLFTGRWGQPEKGCGRKGEGPPKQPGASPPSVESEDDGDDGVLNTNDTDNSVINTINDNAREQNTLANASRSPQALPSDEGHLHAATNFPPVLLDLPAAVKSLGADLKSISSQPWQAAKTEKKNEIGVKLQSFFGSLASQNEKMRKSALGVVDWKTTDRLRRYVSEVPYEELHKFLDTESLQSLVWYLKWVGGREDR